MKNSAKKWLVEKIEITKQTENKSVRAVWSDSATRLSVDLYPRSDTKSQIVVQHLKLPDSTTAASKFLNHCYRTKVRFWLRTIAHQRLYHGIRPP